MSLAASLIAQILAESSTEAWGKLRPNYLPEELGTVYRAIDKHYSTFLNLPTFDELKLGIRDPRTLNKVYALETIEVDAEALALLEYLKNDYVQGELLERILKFVDTTIITATAEESLDLLTDIVTDVRELVDLDTGQEPMKTMDPLYSDEEIARRVPLGFNQEFDSILDFGRTDLILVGGRRGSGKSLTCANIVANQFSLGNTAMYFSIEMNARDTYQRIIAASADIPMQNLKLKNMSFDEWTSLATFQASRYVGGEDILAQYMEDRDYSAFHTGLTRLDLVTDRQIEIVYDPGLSTAKVRSEIERQKAISGDKLSVVAVDYINQLVRRNSADGQYDWKEQVEVSKDLKRIAQELEVLMFVPYQIDATGEARFAKGILDAADGSFVLNAWTKEDQCVTFTSNKMRGGNDEAVFTSTMNWATAKMGPQTALSPAEREDIQSSSEEDNTEEASELF